MFFVVDNGRAVSKPQSICAWQVMLLSLSLVVRPCLRLLVLLEAKPMVCGFADIYWPSLFVTEVLQMLLLVLMCQAGFLVALSLCGVASVPAMLYLSCHVAKMSCNCVFTFHTRQQTFPRLPSLTGAAAAPEPAPADIVVESGLVVGGGSTPVKFHV